MKPGRTLLLLAAVVLALGAVAALLLFVQARERQRAAEAQLEVQHGVDEARARTSPPASVEVPTAEPRGAEAAPGSERAEARTGGLELSVVDPAGAPLAGAAIAIFRGEEVLGSGRSDARGRVDFEAHEGAGEYALAARGWDVARGACELGAGSRTLTLAEGALVAGTVLVDGATPPAQIELNWTSMDTSAGLDSLPQDVQRALVQAYGSGMLPVLRTGPRGEFAFRGLPAAASGTIRWTGPWFLEGQSSDVGVRQIDVPAPRADLVLRLAAGIDLRLRVVDPFGAPVPRGNVTIRRRTRTDSGTHTSALALGALADREGRFTQVMAAKPFEKLIVTVAAADGSGSRAYEFEPRARAGETWDLGDLATDAARELTVLVQDRTSTPIPRARVTPWPAPTRSVSKPTDASGRTTILIAADEREVAAQAFGYVGARVPVPPDASEVVATLESCCVLELEAPGGTNELQLEISGPSPVFVDEKGAAPETLKTEGGSTTQGIQAGETSFLAEGIEPGRWRVAGIRPGVALRAKLRGPGTLPPPIEIPPLAPEEHRRVVLDLGAPAQSLRVRVVSAAGDPLPDTEVLIIDRGWMTTWTSHQVDEQGEVLLDPIFGDRCELRVRAEGLPMKSVLLQPIPKGTYVIALDAPRSVEVELVQRDGSACTEASMVVVGPPGPDSVKGSALGPGKYRLEGLPAGEVLIEVRGPCGSTSVLHDTNVGFARVRVGDPSRIEVTLPRTVDAEAALWRIAVAPAGAERDRSRVPLIRNAEGIPFATIHGLADGTYDVWLEVRSPSAEESWTRVGSAVAAVVDAEHPIARVELAPPP